MVKSLLTGLGLISAAALVSIAYELRRYHRPRKTQTLFRMVRVSDQPTVEFSPEITKEIRDLLIRRGVRIFDDEFLRLFPRPTSNRVNPATPPAQP